MTVDELREFYGDTILYDGLDDAIIGIAERLNLGPVVAYDIDKVINILIETHGMSEIDAIEYFNFNILGMWVGELTPVFIRK